MAKYSVVVPVYNDQKNIGTAIQSLLLQTYQDFEIIIVDDASTDGTWQYLETLENPKIQVLRHNINQGPGAARNTGIRAAKGDFVAFLDSDDRWYPNALDVINKIIHQEENKSSQLFFCLGEIYLKDEMIGYFTRCTWVNHASKNEIYKKLYISNFIATQGVVVKRSVIIDSGGFDESLRSAQDHELWLRLALDVDFHFIDQPLVQYFVRENTVTSNIQRRVSCQLTILKKHDHNIQQITKSKIGYFIIKRRALSNIYVTASWDVFHRGGSQIKGLFLALRALLFFPGPRSCFNLLKIGSDLFKGNNEY